MVANQVCSADVDEKVAGDIGIDEASTIVRRVDHEVTGYDSILENLPLVVDVVKEQVQCPYPLPPARFPGGPPTGLTGPKPTFADSSMDSRCALTRRINKLLFYLV